MKHSALAWTFAAALAAQGQVQGQGQVAPDPKTELAAVIAVEEQERDLGKAEKLYREALAGTKLSAEARAFANLRLGRMLQKLGRDAEAKPLLEAAGKGEAAGFDDFGAAPTPQDVEREKALREKARALVQEILKHQSANWEAPLFGIADPQLAEQLLWIGEPAVPEVIAALQAEIADPENAKKLWAGSGPYGNAVKGLAGFLWRTGGTLSAAFLSSCAKIEDARWREAIVATAFQAEQPAMLAEAARFLNDPDPDDRVVSSLLRFSGATKGTAALHQRFAPEQIVDAALRGPLRGKVRVLGWARSMSGSDAATLTKLHGLVRDGLKSTDPEFGNAAAAFLLSTPSQASIEGIELLLQQLPNMRGATAHPADLPWPAQVAAQARTRFSAAEAVRLLPAIQTCAQALVAAGAAERGKRWLERLMIEVAFALDASVVPEAAIVSQVLAWMDLGYYVWYALDERITAANCKLVFARFDRVSARERPMLLNRLASLELPRDMFPLLCDKADQLRQEFPWEQRKSDDLADNFVRAMAKTGDPAAADWITTLGYTESSFVSSLLELGRRTQQENVRAALRKVASKGATPDDIGRLLLALLSMHDEPALDLVVKLNHVPMRTNHPYAKQSYLATPLQYLLYQNPDPPHGFTEEQVIAVLQKIRTDRRDNLNMNPREYSVGAIPDRILGALARLDRTQYDETWSEVAVQRFVKRNGEGPLATWVDDALTPQSYDGRVLEAFDARLVEKYRARLEALLDGEDPAFAEGAATALLRVRPTADLEHMLTHKHADVRALALNSAVTYGGAISEATLQALLRDKDEGIRANAARFAGATVSKAAVPDLIALLRDGSSSVRKDAADALTRIRFFHEQQAHWDRVLKGLDASPASAAEKLLLQAKPTAPKDQRLLAITSLGTLGVPEALPFLIEWTTDTDAEIGRASCRERVSECV